MPVAPIERNDHSEPNAEAFIFGFDFTPDGAVEKVDWLKVKPTAACPREGWRWLHFNRLADETREWLEASSDLDETVIAALLQTETRPRCAPYEDGLLLNLRGINHNPGAEPEDMISVRVWTTSNLVISMRSYPVKAIHEIREEMGRGDPANSPANLLARIAGKLVDYIDPVVEQLKEEADEFEEELLRAHGRLSPRALAEFRRTILILRRYVQPQTEAMTQLMREAARFRRPNAPVFDETDQVMLRDTGDHIQRIAEELDSIRDRAAVLQDQVAGQRQEQLNQRLLALSIVSAIFLPLSYVTGLLGMNLAGIPWHEDPASFGIVTGITAVLGVGVVAFLKWRRWI
jgi:zinc transporter